MELKMKENTLKQIDYLFRYGNDNDYFMPYQNKTNKETFNIKFSTAKLTQDIFINLANKRLIEHNKKCDSILNFWNNKKENLNYRLDKFLEKNNFNIIENYFSQNINQNITNHYDLYLFEKNDCYYIALSISINGSYHNYTNYEFFQYSSNDSYHLIECLFDDRISLETSNVLSINTMLDFDIVGSDIHIRFIDDMKKLDIEINKLEYFSMYDYIAFKNLNKEQKQIYKKLSYDLRVDYIESFENYTYDSFIYEYNENKLCEYSLELFEYIYKINNDKDIKLNSLPCLYHDDHLFICGFMVQNNEK